MSSPPPKSLVPAPTVWPPSNPSGTVIPFPLPWGQTGCCPPGGMDALMKCYCDIQQASAFIGQVMLDQINNNPAIIAAIIAGIEKSGSSLPTLGVTNGAAAQPGQVGEYVFFGQTVNFPVTAGFTQTVTMGILQPGDWDCWLYAYDPAVSVTSLNIAVSPQPAGTDGFMQAFIGDTAGFEFVVLLTPTAQVLTAVPVLIPAVVVTNQLGAGSAAGSLTLYFAARRAR